MPGCGWWDSNPHGLAPRTLPTTGVYQFRHTRTIVSMLAPLACNDATPAASDTAGRGKLSWRSAQRRTEKRQDEAKKGGGGPRSAPNLLPAAAASRLGAGSVMGVLTAALAGAPLDVHGGKFIRRSRASNRGSPRSGSNIGITLSR